ncbi:M16 family metallopeptidase [Lactobacillus sp. PV034]|uniref:M16 family metallopeptidase n=1 Tax=Lactobacillus sp. PV034 TaxID=2594495 RepID=UPI00223EB927|nr:insulinase family protein [Lactobacillus sp. PV034]QNQ80735.1 insulinase family protein [Lactobacillus sp. PV034]
MTNIQIEHNSKFKTATLGCFLRLPLTQENLALANILAVMQNNASARYPGISIQAKALEEYYDAQLAIFPQVFGNQIILFYVINFIEPKEVLNPDYNYQKIIETFVDIIKNPLFNPSLLYLAKSQLISVRTQYLDIPANYALNRFYQYWYRNLPEYSENIFGDLEVIKKCTVLQIKNFFKTLKEKPAICLGLVESPKLITDLLQEKLDWPGFSQSFSVENLSIIAKYDPIKKVEAGNHEQAQLLLGFGYPNKLSSDLRQFGGIILSQYLAGDESSKLFATIREKMGAAYAIDADNLLDNSLFLISTGINYNKLAETKKQIKTVLKEVAAGKIDTELFNKAQRALKRMYHENKDQENVLLMQMLANSLRGRNLTIDDRINKVMNFNEKKLTQFAQSLFLNESYCLK